MNSYRYTAKDRNGHPAVGILAAGSEAEIIEVLHKKDLTVISVEELKSRKAGALPEGKGVKADDIVIFSRQLATMIDAGIPLVHALGILAEQIENKNLKDVVIYICQDIDEGMSFCDALSRHPRVFSELFINMARAGETSGMLDETLDRLATYLEKSAALTRKIRSSMVYPTVVVSMATLITAVLLIKVVPTFKGIFEILGGQLPVPTQILIAVSEILRRYFLGVMVFLAAAGFLFKKYIDTPAGRYFFDSVKLKAPVLGELFRKVAIAKFARTFSTLTKSGVPILSSLEIVGKTAGNKILEEAVLSCSKAVCDGESISRPLSKSGVFPPMVCRMISVGEQTGQLEKMLSKIADFYDEQVDAAASALTSMIEPLIIAFLGIVIGGIVIALFLPIFQLTRLVAG